MLNFKNIQKCLVCNTQLEFAKNTIFNVNSNEMYCPNIYKSSSHFVMWSKSYNYLISSNEFFKLNDNDLIYPNLIDKIKMIKVFS